MKKVFLVLQIILLLAICSISYAAQSLKEYYHIDGKYYIEYESNPNVSPWDNPRKMNQVIKTYEEYQILEQQDGIRDLLGYRINRDFFNANCLVLVQDSTNSARGIAGSISKIDIKDNVANITIKRDSKDFGSVAGEIRTYFIPITNTSIENVTVTYKFPVTIGDFVNVILRILPFAILIYSITMGILRKKKLNGINDTEIKVKKKAINRKMITGIIVSIVVFLFLEFVNSVTSSVAYKPIIYLYPTEETAISVTVGNPERLTHTYPKYNNSWNVIAEPNGNLTDINTGRSLYALYWEGINTVKPNMSEGFVIEGKDTIAFLEEKLEMLGLNEREANEFIIYWLPKLESNKYNFIRFQTIEEINTNMPLDITPTPDTVIRVMMEFKALNKKINVKEQVLETPQRDGFVVVEWGGTEIK